MYGMYPYYPYNYGNNDDLVLDGFGLSSLLSSLFSSYGEEIIIAATMETVADKKHINCAFLLAKNPLI